MLGDHLGSPSHGSKKQQHLMWMTTSELTSVVQRVKEKFGTRTPGNYIPTTKGASYNLLHVKLKKKKSIQDTCNLRLSSF